MKGTRALAAVLVLAVAIAPAAACDDSALPDGRAKATALFAATSLADTPWPSDVFLRNGTLAVTDVPLEGAQPATRASLAASLSELDGAPTYTSVFFPYDDPGRSLHTGTIAGAKAHWVDLGDATAPKVTTAVFAREETHEVVALPPPDAVLVEGHRYAVFLVGSGLAVPSAMRDAIEDRGPNAAAFAGARAAMLAVSPELGPVTVFTVGHHTRIAEKMRDVAAKLPPARANVTKVYAGADVDELLGKPTTTRPGLGDPKGVVHDQLEAVVLGTFDAPSFLTATPPQLGRVELDASGTPIVKGTQPITFMLTLPKKPAAGFGKLPVIIFQHGLNAGRTQVVTCANDYARAGYATIGIDALWHGSRAKIAKDTVHNFTGAAGPDGLADNDDFGASIQIFDFDGDPSRGIGSLDGRYVRDNFRQAMVDLAELARFVQTGDLSPIAAAHPSFAGVSFDGSNLVYTSESFGSVIGASGVALANVKGGVLSVGGGGVFLAVLPSSPQFNGLVTPLLRTTFDPALDISDPVALPGPAQRSLSLLQAAFAPGDPLSFVPSIVAQKKNLLLLQARSDELIPNQATELLAVAAKATSVSLPARSEPLRFVKLPTAPAPYSAAPTIAIVQIAPALHTMFTGFEGDRRFQLDFPPFVALPTPEKVQNPIELVHGIAIAFADSLRAPNAAGARVDAPP